MPEKICLKLNDFQDNIYSVFGSLRQDRDFADVTLACEDGQQIDAHKVILAASSPVFQSILKSNKHSHPLIYMRGITSEDLLTITDFMYFGEANIFQENLESFLAIAEDLKLTGLTGLTGSKEVFGKNTDNSLTRPNSCQMNTQQIPEKETSMVKTEPKESSFTAETFQPKQSDHISRKRRRGGVIPNYASEDLKEVDKKVKSLMELSAKFISNGKEKARICKACGKEGERKAIRDHIEVNHLEGISLPCNLCDKTFRSRQRMRKHKCNS